MTRVLKGCLKAAGWDARDDEGAGGEVRNEMSIKSQSKNIRAGGGGGGGHRCCSSSSPLVHKSTEHENMHKMFASTN